MWQGARLNCGYAIYNKWLNVVLMTPKLLLGPLTPICPDLDMSQAHYHTGAHRDAFIAVIRDGNMDRQFKNPNTGTMRRVRPSNGGKPPKMVVVH